MTTYFAVGSFICVCGLLLLLRFFIQWKIKETINIGSENGIDTLEKISVGDLPQWIQIRGHDIKNPVLLYLHGGPGWSELPYAHLFCEELEKNFVVVQWAQRGAGKSYAWGAPPGPVTINDMVDDVVDLINYLCGRFSAQKVTLVGHSWGSVLGIMAAQKYPQRIASYFGVSQIVNMEENERISRDMLLELAREKRNTKAHRQLTAISLPVVRKREAFRISQWIHKFRGDYHDGRSPLRYIAYLLISPQYSLLDVPRYLFGLYHSARALRGELGAINFTESISQLDVPVTFICGRYDIITPAVLVEQFVARLKAPLKDHIWFECSAHSPHLEESQKFQELLIRRASVAGGEERT